MTGPTTDLAGVLADARALDLLAAGERPDDPAVALLADFREALQPSLSPHPVRRRSGRRWRRAVVIAALTAAIPAGGVAAASVQAHPGDALYRIRRAVAGRTADDPWQAHQVVRRVRDTLSVTPTPNPAQVRDATALLARARVLTAQLRERDAVPLRHEIDRLEARVTTPGRTRPSRDPSESAGVPRPPAPADHAAAGVRHRRSRRR